MPVDDERVHASATELIGEHQPGRAGADNQNVSHFACQRCLHAANSKETPNNGSRTSIPSECDVRPWSNAT